MSEPNPRSGAVVENIRVAHVSASNGDAAPAPLAHDVAFALAGLCSTRRQPTAQAVPRVKIGIEAGTLGRSFDDGGNGLGGEAAELDGHEIIIGGGSMQKWGRRKSYVITWH